VKEAVYQDRDPEAPVAKEASEQAAPGSFIGDLGKATEVKAEPIHLSSLQRSPALPMTIY
jgi:hypothetical protein